MGHFCTGEPIPAPRPLLPTFQVTYEEHIRALGFGISSKGTPAILACVRVLMVLTLRLRVEVPSPLTSYHGA